MNTTNIEWTAFSANPLKYRRKSDGKVVWACVKTSPGCAHCYSEGITLRYQRGKLFNAKNMEELEPFLDEAEVRKMLTANTIGGVQVSGSRCFVGDMTDVFGEWVPDELLDRLFAVFALRSDVTWQVLTKRAERMRAYFNDEDEALMRMAHAASEIDGEKVSAMRGVFARGYDDEGKMDELYLEEIPNNVWLGVSVEDQKRADERIPHLLATPAAVRFLSCEPLLGSISLSFEPGTHAHLPGCLLDGIGWVIVGGESGPGARPCDVGWIRSIVEQCKAAGVPLFVKQDSGKKPGMQGRIPDDLWIKEFPDGNQRPGKTESEQAPLS